MAYPTAATTFSSKNNGDTIQPAHVNDLQTEIAAIEAALLSTGLAHNLFPSGTRTLGTSSALWDKVYGTALIVGAETTSGARLDIEAGTLAVREGDDSAYAPLKALTLEATTTLTVGTTSIFTGIPTFSSTTLHADDIVFSGNKTIRRNTSDGSDNGEIALLGGGADAYTRGGSLRAYGNENADAGSVKVRLGTVANAVFLVQAAGGDWVSVFEDDGEFRAQGVYNLTSASAANVFVDTDGQLLRSTSSLRVKRWRDLTIEEARAALALSPIAFTSTLPDADPAWLFFGFGAEPTYDTHRAFGVPGRDNYDTRAILAAVTKLVQDHETRLTALEPVH